MSLRWRVAAGMALIAAVIGIAAALGAYFSTEHQLEHSLDDSLLASATDAIRVHDRLLRGALFPTGSTPTRPSEVRICPAPGDLQPAAAAQVLAVDGTISASCIEAGPEIPVDAGDLAMARRGGAPRFRTVTIDDEQYRVLTVPWTGGGVLQVARSLAETDDVLASLQLRLVALGVAGIVAAAVLGWLLARRIVRPVERLRDAAEHIARTQDLSVDVPVNGHDEVGSLARSFTTMVHALAMSREQQHQLVTDASHELRTPLTSLRTNIEFLDRADDLPSEERREILDSLKLEANELTNLVTELVDLATDRSSEEPPEPVRLADLAGTVVGRARRRSGRLIELQEDGDETIVGRPQMLERAIGNLVDNALKYAPVTEPVEVVVGGRRLEVRDRGPGIDPEDQPHVFDRFYRSTQARTQPGSGLGLAIVKEVVEAHGGTVWASNRPGGGASVGFELPAS